MVVARLRRRTVQTRPDRSRRPSGPDRFDGARAAPAADLPRKTQLIVKAAVSLIVFAAIALYTWLNLWLGFDTLTMLVVGAVVSQQSTRLMSRLSAKLAPELPGSVREGDTSRTFGWANAPLYLASGLLLAWVILAGFSSHTMGWRNTPTAPGLVFAACLALWAWTKHPQVRYLPSAHTGIGRRRVPAGKATTALVVVHGIGSQKPAEPLHMVADPIKDFLYEQVPGQVLVRHQAATESRQERVEFVYEAREDGRRAKQKLVVTEVLWANIAHRANGLTTFGWLIRSLPILLALPFAPDRHDLRHGNLVRIAYRIVFPLVIALALLQPALRLLTLAGLVILAGTTVFRKSNLIGDVRMAATDDTEVAKITSEINLAIDSALVIADRVVVVGHSQGGYLSYRALLQRGPAAKGKSIHLVGVGSGLKPIWVLKQFTDSWTIFRTWLLVIGSILVLTSLLPVFLGFLAFEKPDLITWSSKAALSLSDITSRSPFRPVNPDWGVATHSLLVFVPDYRQIILFAVGVALVLLGRRKAVFLSQPDAHPLARPAAARRWMEITSSIDSVGRLAYPHLFEAEVWDNPSYGNPLLDHISYFRRSSPVTWYLACYLFAPLLGNATPALRRWANYLDVRVWRARSFATTLGIVLLGYYAINRVNPSARGLASLSAQVTHPGYILFGLLLIAAINPALAVRDRYRTSRVIASRPIEPPPRIRQISIAPRCAIFFAWVSAAAFAFGSGHHLIRYAPMTSTEVRILPVAPIVIGILLCALAAALGAGYLFPWWFWVLSLSFIFYMSSYLPGEGQIYLFLDSTVLLLAALSVFSLKMFARDIELSDTAWPGYIAAVR
jgi:hypothetical protein